MSHANGVISEPVSVIDDLKVVLNTSSNSVSELCRNNNVNKWSPRKPIYSTKKQRLSGDDWKGAAHVITGYKTGGGLKKVVKTGSAYLNELGSNGVPPTAVWTWDKPILGESVMRVSDFIGYRHTIGCPISSMSFFGNVNYILIPTTNSESGRSYSFSFNFNVQTGMLTCGELFGDCSTYYPTIVISYGGSSNPYQIHYAKSASQPISYYTDATASASISVDSAVFMKCVAADWSSHYSGNPYGGTNYPFRRDDEWTAVMVLCSTQINGAYDQTHKLSSDCSIVRLEFVSSPASGVYMDRKTLPVKPTKYMTIDKLLAKVYLTRVGIENGYEVYELSQIDIKANMLSTSSITLTVGDGTSNSYISTPAPNGYVNITGVGQGSSVTLNNFFQVTFSGTTGWVTKTFVGGTNYPTTKYYVPLNTSEANNLINGSLALYYSNLGSFVGGWGDVHITSQSYQYTREFELK